VDGREGVGDSLAMPEEALAAFGAGGDVPHCGGVDVLEVEGSDVVDGGGGGGACLWFVPVVAGGDAAQAAVLGLGEV